ncbi:MAG: Low-specificity L-threonine aldolase [Acidimicrobiia bacterium]|jgi:threonine aldolase|nr:Low-specificity L-threonine aldolase [Acidimicrobiia bacterium]
MDPNEAEIDRIRRACTRWLAWHGDRTAAGLLSELPTDITPDRYGDGGVVEELETYLADLLGMPAAAFFVSGTMAQQIALRIHADRRNHRTIAFHPTSHVEMHEGGAFERLHHLVGRPVGDPYGPLTLESLEEVAEPLGALLLELPQREIGGQLPDWEDLLAQTAWARDRGAAIHLDGARLWQCPPAYDRPLEEIAGLFDSVYVSFYKDLGALAGSGLVGPEDFIAEAREWRLRHGGTLFAMWPYAASALASVRSRLPRMKSYRDHGLAIAGALRDLDRVRVVPDPPHTSMFHLHLGISSEVFKANALRIAEEEGIWTWKTTFPGTHPDWQIIELTVGDSTLDFEPGEVGDLITRLVAD